MPKAYRRAGSSTGIRHLNGIELFADRGDEDIPDSKLPAVAARVVNTKASHFDSSTFIDHYETALVERLRAKQARRFLVALANAFPS